MGVRYEKLFHLLDERNMTTRELERQAGFSGNMDWQPRFGQKPT